LFDHLIRGAEHCSRDDKAKRFGGLEIGDDVELGWLKAVCEWPTERPHSTGSGVVTFAGARRNRDRMSTTPSMLRAKGT
jgi:hypothetical protein